MTQIDQQAAELLGKTERPGSDELKLELKLDTSTKLSGVDSLKDQLKKKRQNSNDYLGKLDTDSNASELQTTIMEIMEAVELEKQKHNNTRMEALQRFAKLETANADLAKSLATMQKKLELEIDQVAELQQQIELKEAAHEELRRRISRTHQPVTYLNPFTASKGVEFECKILEAEYSLTKELEANIELTRKETEEPTEIEIELKRRLGQLTDHLIQKQAQVEALSSDRATLLFRIETVSRMLDESKSNINGALPRDLESGTWKLSDSKLQPPLQDKIRSGKKQLGSLLLQLDAIFSAGVVFLRRNPTAKMRSLVYLFCLHFWVLYILMSHSRYQMKQGPKLLYP
ncbi:hypothetical protein SLE2022_295710 [Rubroshorea leprosula]